ncbi:GHKL domain-containing protein [Tissierella sp.]
MKDRDGVQTAQKIRKRDKHTIIFFITSYVNFLSDTFRVGAFQFLIRSINAIEACEKISSENEKKIQLKIIQIEEYLSIEISNSIIDKVKLEKGRSFTTKKDKLFHGFGLESIKEIVEKYNGHINYEQEENTFIVNILLQNSIVNPILQK